MLDFIYIPISWLLSLWHTVISTVIAPTSGVNWALSIIMLVVTLRLALLWPMIKQTRTMRQLQDMQPKIKAVQAKYKNDRQRQGEEIRKIQKENGANPLLGCLPMLLQVPVFIGLFHVLRVIGSEGSDNYAFSDEEVLSFRNADIFGAPLGAQLSQSTSRLGEMFGADHTQLKVALIAIPLMLISAGATHFNARVSIARQTQAASSAPQAAIMNRVMLWIFPIGILATGFLWTIGLLVYMSTNNTWSLLQQILIYRKMDGEQKLKEELKAAVRADLAPRPGQRPVRAKDSGASAATVVADVEKSAVEPDSKPAKGKSKSGKRTAGNGVKATSGVKANGSIAPAGSSAAADAKPGGRPNAASSASESSNSGAGNAGGSGTPTVGAKPKGQSARRAAGSRKNKKKRR